MPGRDYRKKPITDKLRKCAWPSCSKPFPPSKEDQRYCCRKHGEKHWHEVHKPKYKYPKHNVNGPMVESAGVATRRDRPERWIKYMRDNPGYFEDFFGTRSIDQVAAEIFSGRCRLEDYLPDVEHGRSHRSKHNAPAM